MRSLFVAVQQRYRWEEQLLYRPRNGNKKVDLLLLRHQTVPRRDLLSEAQGRFPLRPRLPACTSDLQN